MTTDRWEVAVSLSDGNFSQVNFQFNPQVSFVNSICTIRGGNHVNHIADQICDNLIEQIRKKAGKNSQIKPNQIKQHLFIFCNCLIENPTFDTQTKEFLTTKVSAFGSKCVLTDKFLKEIRNSGIVEIILAQSKAKDEAKLAKVMKGQKNCKLLGITKLEDANDAGKRNADKCTLIITEGDSAKALAMSGNFPEINSRHRDRRTRQIRGFPPEGETAQRQGSHN